MKDIIKNGVIMIILLLVLIYLLYFFSISNNIKNLIRFISKYFNSYENFIILNRPNKIYKHDGKIYLLNTKDYHSNSNPIIFENYKEFSEYISSLEEEHMDNFMKHIKQLKETNIEELKIPRNIKNNSKNDRNFQYSKKCSKRGVLCNLNEDNDLLQGIISPEKLKEYKEMKCYKKILSDKKCQDYDSIAKNERRLNNICKLFKNRIDFCDKVDKYQQNKKIIDEFCLKDKKKYDLDTCLYNEYYKENIMDFDL